MNHIHPHGEDVGSERESIFNIPLPPWARFILVVGPTATIALFLTWRLDARSSTQVAVIQDLISKHAAQTEHMSFVIDDYRAELRRLVALQRQTCINTSKTEAQQMNCNPELFGK